MKPTLRSLALVSALIASGIAQAVEIDTDHLFAFNKGTDLGEPGEKEILAGFESRLGRIAGHYSALTGSLSFQYTPVRDFQFEVEGAGTSHSIDNVPGMDDRHSAAFSGMSLVASYRLLDRENSGLGLSLTAAPFWTRVDDDSGAPVNGYGAEFTLALDKELVENRLVAVFNVHYEPGVAQSRIDESWAHENVFGLSGGLMARLGDNLFGGMEARYLRRYETLGFSDFAGQAFYLGPTVSIAVSKQAWLTAGWNAQVAGRAAGEQGALDLINFSRHEIRLFVGTTF